ncbi:MAG: glycosyltransferase [Legionellaceae bacterium]|nr:glycosyltransferase [Legionellaceae bacterium]
MTHNTLSMRYPDVSLCEASIQSARCVESPENYVSQRREILKFLMQNQIERALGVSYGHTQPPGFFPKDLDVTIIDVCPKTSKGRYKQPLKLSFPEQQFDVVYCFNVLEHFSEREIERLLHEMQRVSKRYVLLALPLNEDLNRSSFYCGSCCASNALKGRLGAYSIDTFLKLGLTSAFRHAATFLPGDTIISPKMKFARLYAAHAYAHHYVEYRCLHCGCDMMMSGKTLVSSAHAPHTLTMVASYQEQWCRYSEALLLLTREGHRPHLPRQETRICHMSLLDIEFSNTQQRVREAFMPGALWSRFALGRGMKVDSTGISLVDATQSNITPARIQLPVKVKVGDQLHLTVSGMKHASFSLFGVDGIAGRAIPLFEKTCVESKYRQLTIKIIAEWLPDSFGSALDLYLYGELTVHRIAYRSEGAHSVNQAFLTLKPGLNSVEITTSSSVPVFRTYYADTQGKIPVSLAERPLQLLKSRDVPKQKEVKASSLNATLKNMSFARLRRVLKRVETNILYQVRIFSNNVRVKLFRRFISLIEVSRMRVSDNFRKLFFPNDILNVNIALTYPKRWKPIEEKAIPALSDAVSDVLVLSHLFPHPDQPGVGSFVLEQLESLQKEGVNVRVIAGRPFWFGRKRNPFRILGEFYNFFRFYRACSERWWMIEGVPVRYLPYPILGTAAFNGWCYHRAIAWHKKKLKRAFKFDFIHAHTGHLDGGAARILAKKMRCAYIITEHTGPFSSLMQQPQIRRATLRALRKAAYVTAVSKSQRQHILAYMGHQYDEKIHVIHNVVNLDLFHASRVWNPDPMAPKILFVGYFVPVKNISLLLEAFQRVHAERPRATLMLVGGGESREQEEAIHMQLKQLNIEQAVEMRGYTARKDVASLMSDVCDMLVLSSKSESFGCVVAEALAVGKPAVVTRCGGPEDIVIADWMGRICENHNPQALADAILSVADQLPSLDAEKISTSAASRFSSEVITKAHVQLYEALLK